MSPLVAVRPLRSVVEKLAKLIGLCVTVTLSEAVKLILDALSIVGTPVPRTPFLLLKAPVSTLYEEKFGGDRNMFTGKNA